MSSQRPKAPPIEAKKPEHGEQLDHEVLEVQEERLDDGRDARRVEKTFRRVIDEKDNIAFIEPGDTLATQWTREWKEKEVEDVGSHISSSQGMHVKLEGRESPIHLRLIQRWLEGERAFIYGERSTVSTELEGVDYE